MREGSGERGNTTGRERQRLEGDALNDFINVFAGGVARLETHYFGDYGTTGQYSQEGLVVQADTYGCGSGEGSVEARGLVVAGSLEQQDDGFIKEFGDNIWDLPDQAVLITEGKDGAHLYWLQSTPLLESGVTGAVHELTLRVERNSEQ
ncbi:MAG TPA: hypothetical protein VJP80_02855 [Candidatus Saccharimonadales bacterium]|nr:hypothetical protein [Candidatus Saccharimonadales bacterium]